METFLFSDGTKLEFERLTTIGNTIQVTQPSKNAGRYVPTVEVHVVAGLHAAIRKDKYKEPTGFPHPVGLTAQALAIGIPAGVYVPLSYNRYNGRYEIMTSRLINETLIIDERVASQELQDKLKKMADNEYLDPIPTDEDPASAEVETEATNANVPATA